LFSTLQPGSEVIRGDDEGEWSAERGFSGVGGAEEVDPPAGVALVDAEQRVIDKQDVGRKGKGTREGDALVKSTRHVARKVISEEAMPASSRANWMRSFAREGRMPS
jgi:hypothetical protein